METGDGPPGIGLVGPGSERPCGIGDYVRSLERALAAGAQAAGCRLVRASYQEALSGTILEGCRAVLVHYERSLVPGPGYMAALTARFPGRVFVAPHEVYREDPFAFPFAGLRSAFPPLLWLKRLRYRLRHREYAGERDLQRAGYHAHRVIPLSRDGGEILRSLAASPEIAARILPAIPVARIDPPPAAPAGAADIAGAAESAIAAPPAAARIVQAASPFPGHTGAVAGIFGFLNPGLDYGAALELVEAMAPRLALLLLGGDRPGHRMAPGLEAEIRRRGLSDRVRITGYLPEAELASRLAACDFFLCPMRFKSSTASVLRLFRQGRPILVPELPLTRYLADEGAPIRLYSGAGGLRALAEAAADGSLEPVPDRYPWDVAKVAGAYLEAMAGPA